MLCSFLYLHSFLPVFSGCLSHPQKNTTKAKNRQPYSSNPVHWHLFDTRYCTFCMHHWLQYTISVLLEVGWGETKKDMATMSATTSPYISSSFCGFCLLFGPQPLPYQLSAKRSFGVAPDVRWMWDDAHTIRQAPMCTERGLHRTNSRSPLNESAAWRKITACLPRILVWQHF